MLTHLKLTTDKDIAEPGTANFKGEKIYPVTPTLLKRLGASADIIERLKKKHRERANIFHNNPALRKYQQQDVSFLVARDKAGCFNEQRTGKTPTICDTINQKKLHKVLIVCPASMVLVWREEFTRWTGLSCIAVTGTAKQKIEQIKNWTEGLVISYDSLRVNVNEQGMLYEILKHKNIECVVADEAHRISNRKSKQAEALFKLRNVPHRYALTGTPAPNKQEQVYSILHFLFPDIFNGYWNFINYYFKTYTETNHTQGNDYTVIGNLYPGKDKELQEFLNAISTQRKRKDVMEWLPDKDYTTVKLDLTKQQLKYLTQLRNEFEVEHISTQNTLEQLLRERQICLDPGLLELKGSSPKLDWIKQYLQDYPDKSIIIFSKFTSWLNRLALELGTPSITGDTPLSVRKHLCSEFQARRLKVLLINIDAGKEGLTLDTAQVTIFTDRFPPVGALQQAEDRFVSTTEDKKDKEHSVFFLVMKDTYEELIECGIADRLSSTDMINNYKKYLKEN